MTQKLLYCSVFHLSTKFYKFSSIAFSILDFTISAMSTVFISLYSSYEIGSKYTTLTVTGLMDFSSKGRNQSISATGTIGHLAFVALLKLPPLKVPGLLPCLLLVPSAKIRKLRPFFTSSAVWLITCID